jgi:hypothetical protein
LLRFLRFDNKITLKVIHLQTNCTSTNNLMLKKKKMNTKKLLLIFLLSFTTMTIFAQSPFSQEGLDVSKGYFADKILVNWEIVDDSNINSFNIYRRILTDEGNSKWVNQGNFSANERRFEDVDVEGGVLHEYKIQIIANDKTKAPHDVFVTEVGLRSPVAIVTGNVSFAGGAAVKGVTVSAKSQSSSANTGAAIKIPFDSYLSIDEIKEIKDEITFQAWVKPEKDFKKLVLFDNTREVNAPPISKQVFTHIENIGAQKIQIRTDLHFFEVSEYYPTGELDANVRDSLMPIATFADRFNHISIVLNNKDAESPQLYINGIAINVAYIDEVATIKKDDGTALYPNFAVVKGSKSNIEWGDTNDPESKRTVGMPFEIKNGTIGRGSEAPVTFDEIRIWKTALSKVDIKNYYNRYIDGNDARLVSYLRLNEGLGRFAYDISRDGSFYNKNHYKFYNTRRFAATPLVTGNVLTNDVMSWNAGIQENYLRVTTNTVRSNKGVDVTIDEKTGAFTYASPPGVIGEDSFPYTIKDSLENESSSRVSIQIYSIAGKTNEAAYAINDTIYTYQETSVKGNVLGNDYDPNGDPIKVTTTTVTTSDGEEVSIDKDTGSYVYSGNFSSDPYASFEYEICDADSLQCANARVFLNQIASSNTGDPYANIDYYNTIVGADLTVVTVPWVSGTADVPTKEQLSADSSLTDENGNYSIPALAYYGNGELFTIKPSLGVHDFEPAETVVYLGKGDEVVNQLDFTDVSSFTFYGKVLYDTRGVFKPKTDGVETGYIGLDTVYNRYKIGNEFFKMGEYWLNGDDEPKLEAYVPISLAGANVYIDGEIVKKDGENVLTDAEGKFEVEVPIGNHVITVQKEGHVFTRQGRFPEAGVKHLFENDFDKGNPVIFLDKTRVVVVGKVVGGKIESDKVIGFGVNTGTSNNDAKEVSSKNNVGVAKIPLFYNPVFANANLEREFIITTDALTGEFREELLPIDYEIVPSKVVFAKDSHPNKFFMTGVNDLPVKLSKIPEEIVSTYSKADSVKVTSAPYHYYLNKLPNLQELIIAADPVIEVGKQESDPEVIVDGKNVKISDYVTDIAFYTQGKTYEIGLTTYEIYNNYDVDPANPVEDRMPIAADDIIINNPLTSAKTYDLVVSPDGDGIKTYKFRADALSNTQGTFNLTLSITYNGTSAENLKGNVILIGGAAGSELTFATKGPEIPSFILRDPPGSNSFATISEGTSISFTASSALNETESSYASITTSLGPDFTAGLLLAYVDTDATADATAGFSGSTSATTDENYTKTYTFSQTISTSNDPMYVGSDGDLYFGESSNILYGSYDNLEFSKVSRKDVNQLTFAPKNDKKKPIYLTAKRIYKLVPGLKPSYFVYSQKEILENLIPELIGLADTEPEGSYKSRQYEESIRLWKTQILQNEIDKYLAFNKHTSLKDRLKGKGLAYINLLNKTIQSNKDRKITDNPWDIYDERLDALLNKKNTVAYKVQNLLDSKFKDNISFDAGVGEFSRSVETAVVTAKSTEYNLFFDETLSGALGITAAGIGAVASAGGVWEDNITQALSEEQGTTTTIGYTLKDNDNQNLLSVDVINLFDGNGPIFITQGGRTSCPYEAAETSNFVSAENVKSFLEKRAVYEKQIDVLRLKLSTFVSINSAGVYNKEISSLRTQIKFKEGILHRDFMFLFETSSSTPEDKKVLLGQATQRLEIPKLDLLSANPNPKGIPEADNAEFIFQISNQGLSNTDSNFRLKLEVKQGFIAPISNLKANGTIVKVRAGETVDFLVTVGKSSAGVFDYDGLSVVLESLCDTAIKSEATAISVSFVPSCSKVLVSAPRDNFVFNIYNAYEKDDKGTSTGEEAPLNIKLTDFNTTFKGLEKIELSYRLATASNGISLTTYYAEGHVPDGTKEEQIIGTKSALTFNELKASDFAGANGIYVIQAKSTCTGGLTYISEVTGTVDLNAPQRFGTPLPINGILAAGEDLKVSFNEDIFYIDGNSKVVVKGLKNRTSNKNKHDVSLYFEGNNTAAIEKPRIVNGAFSFEFWMKNLTTASEADVFYQEGVGGLKISLNNNQMVAKLGEMQVAADMIVDVADSESFHHYAIIYNDETGILKLIVDGNTAPPKDTRATNTKITNSNTLFIGGNTFIGNIHDVRLWGKSLQQNEIRSNIIGNEAGLFGYWPMNEGHDNIAHDLAYFNHAKLNVGWDIRPKGTSFEFNKETYLELNDLGSVFITNTMDATISFWIKVNAGEVGTIFSIGRGDSTDELNPSGFRNKWAINMNVNGLSFESEAVSYALTTANVADNSWHHITLLFNRLGSLNTYVDAQKVSSNPMATIGGFTGNKAWLGARGFQDAQNNVSIDNQFSGKMDEFRFWNSLRNVEQINRDRYYEVDSESLGLLLYARMENDHTYYYETPNGITGGKAVKNGQNGGVSNDVPPIKPEQNISPLTINHVIKGNQMVLDTEGVNWAEYEGQIVDVTVAGMYDAANNKQESAITWTAFIQQNDLKWYADGYNEIANLLIKSGQEESFDIIIVNRGGNLQPFNIGNVPSWLQLSTSSGTISPDSQIKITATIDAQLSIGEYVENLSLQTDFGYDQKLQVSLRVLAEEPDWKLDPNDFEYSMNIIGKLKVDEVFSDDIYDKVAAFSKGEVRGVANIVYNEAYQEYFVFLTVYSNTASVDPINFSIWDATQGKILQSSVNTNISIPFKENEVKGSLISATLFANTGVVEQQIITNAGWTWISMNVNDKNTSNLNGLIPNATLENQDRILSVGPARYEIYTKDELNISQSFWSASTNIASDSIANYMYKVYFANKQILNIKGVPVDISTWDFTIKEKWNWLPYPLNKNVSVNEALSLFDAVEDDVIKSQNLFAIYDKRNGWIGTLNYLEEGQGYMIKSSGEQTFKYSNIFGKNSNYKNSVIDNKQAEISTAFTKYPDNMNAVVLLPEGYNDLYVYDEEGVLKGQSKNQSIGDKSLSFITIYGEASEALTFHVGNSFNQKRTSKQIKFKGNSILGTVAKPMVLEDDLLIGVQLHPNPFNKKFVLELYTETEQDIEVKMYNIVGQLVYADNKVLKKGNSKLDISPKVTSGIYFLHVYLNNVVSTYKVIKN